ncbi:MAG: alpha-1,2-fucosyltransferase [Lachnospiraceae bacterium]|nr:alpha-1,2-fucosyltransferase [Lachnospiraceae bacterium]
MIIVRIWEGLGNQLFQYAFARALSLSTNQKVFLDIRETGSCMGEQNKVPRECGLGNFRIFLPICSNVQHFYPYINGPQAIKEAAKWISINGWLPYKYYEESEFGYHEELLRLDGNWYLQGWFQDSRYFDKYSAIIAKEIFPRKRIRISKTLREHLRRPNTVSVHIRRGDYTRTFNAIPDSYYVNAMKHMKELVDKPFWIIFSDEPEWVKQNIDFGDHCYYVSGNECLRDYEEMFVMSCCKNNIIANSTFSWWGAWLNSNHDKVVIAPNHWFLKGIFGCEKNILPVEWIRESF